MRRLISITLLVLFSLPLISPLLAYAGTSDSNLPACCRRNGAHHCTMSPEQLAARAAGPAVSILQARCPMFPRALGAVHHQQLSFHHASLLFAEVLAHPAQHRQVEAWARAALAGARHKRGPPAIRLS